METYCEESTVASDQVLRRGAFQYTYNAYVIAYRTFLESSEMMIQSIARLRMRHQQHPKALDETELMVTIDSWGVWLCEAACHLAIIHLGYADFMEASRLQALSISMVVSIKQHLEVNNITYQILMSRRYMRIISPFTEDTDKMDLGELETLVREHGHDYQDQGNSTNLEEKCFAWILADYCFMALGQPRTDAIPYEALESMFKEAKLYDRGVLCFDRYNHCQMLEVCLCIRKTDIEAYTSDIARKIVGAAIEKVWANVVAPHANKTNVPPQIKNPESTLLLQDLIKQYLLKNYHALLNDTFVEDTIQRKGALGYGFQQVYQDIADKLGQCICCSKTFGKIKVSFDLSQFVNIERALKTICDKVVSQKRVLAKALELVGEKQFLPVVRAPQWLSPDQRDIAPTYDAPTPPPKPTGARTSQAKLAKQHLLVNQRPGQARSLVKKPAPRPPVGKAPAPPIRYK